MTDERFKIDFFTPLDYKEEEKYKMDNQYIWYFYRGNNSNIECQALVSDYSELRDEHARPFTIVSEKERISIYEEGVRPVYCLTFNGLNVVKADETTGLDIAFNEVVEHGFDSFELDTAKGFKKAKKANK